MQDSLEEYIRLTRNVKTEDNVKISKEFQITAHYKKECDTRALQIVEFCIDGRLRTEVFIKCLPFVTSGHYQDIVEERAITKLCGYPVCGKRIPEMPKKQYLISTKSNKIYDITERKNFCSNFCYTASLHIKKQIDTSPLWLRKLQDIPEYNLLQPSEGGLPGEYIDPGIVKPVSVEQNFTSVSSFTNVGLSDLIDQEIKPEKLSRDRPKSFKKSSKLKNTMQTINENEVIEDQNRANKVQNNAKKKEVKETIKNEVATCKKDVHKKGVVINLPAIEENEEQKENNSEKGKSLDKQLTEQSELKENTNTKSLGKISPNNKRLKTIDFVNNIKEILPNKEDESSTKMDLIHDIKSIENSRSIKDKLIQENKELLRQQNIKANEKKLNLVDAKKDLSKIHITEHPEKEAITQVNESSQAEEKTKKDSKKNKNKTSELKIDLETQLKNVLSSWLTLDTCIFVHGESKVKEILSENKLSGYFDELHVIDLERDQQMKYMQICRRLQLREMADDKFDSAATGNHKLKPLPDYKELKQEAKDLTLKVKSFFQGEMYEEPDVHFPTKINKKEYEEPPAVLPLVDASSQNLMRRKIFLNSIKKGMQQLLQSLGISYYTTILSDLQGLVKTFSLRSDNITFKPAFWTYISLILLHMLALRDAEIKQEIEEPRAQEYIKILCDAFSNKNEFLGDILSDIINIELFVKNYVQKPNT